MLIQTNGNPTVFTSKDDNGYGTTISDAVYASTVFSIDARAIFRGLGLDRLTLQERFGTP